MVAIFLRRLNASLNILTVSIKNNTSVDRISGVEKFEVASDFFSKTDAKLRGEIQCPCLGIKVFGDKKQIADLVSTFKQDTLTSHSSR